MAKRKKKEVLKFNFLFEDEPRDYQAVLEEEIGMQISKLPIYHPNWDEKTNINGHELNDSSRAWFIPDATYEIIINKITYE